jgi:hypothetical protein
LAVSGAYAQVGSRDRYFTRYPFDGWQAAGEKTQIRWIARVRPAQLTAHQRLSARIEVELTAKELEKRRGHGELATMIQLENASGRRWRIHSGFNLSSIPGNAKPVPLTYSQEVFLLPGEYKVSIATCDSSTGEYSFTRRDLHVPALRADNLERAWRDLPDVEFIHQLDGPDGWFQPGIRGRVRVDVATSRPVHIDVVMNMTPSERPSGSVQLFRRNMSVLVPALKLLAAMEASAGSLDVTLLDLTRRRCWEQKDARGLDWKAMRAPLAENQPGVIDAQSLAVKAQMAQFFRDQILLRAQPREGRDELRVVIVLSAPAFLGNQFRLEDARLEPDPNRRIFYLRYRPVPPHPDLRFYTPGSGAMPVMAALPADDLEHALKPLDARVFTAASPEEFRKALCAMLTEIGRM